MMIILRAAGSFIVAVYILFYRTYDADDVISGLMRFL